MPMIDKPAFWCRDGWSELWDALEIYVDFVETNGVAAAIDCDDWTPPTSDDIEDFGCIIMCQIIAWSPIARCILPLSATSFIEVDCP